MDSAAAIIASVIAAVTAGAALWRGARTDKATRAAAVRSVDVNDFRAVNEERRQMMDQMASDLAGLRAEVEECERDKAEMKAAFRADILDLHQEIDSLRARP